MGNTLSVRSFIPCLEPPKQHKFIIHGLDASGKTSFLYGLKQGEVVTTIPTIGFNVETLRVDGREYVGWDVGGRDKIRPLWRHYYHDTDAVVFMVDSADIDRLDQARDEFHRMINEEELAGKPVLLLCNKQDLLNAWTPSKIGEFIGVQGSKNKRVFGCSVKELRGMKEGLQWLVDAIEDKTIEEEEETSSETSESDDDWSVVSSEKHELSYDPTRTGGNETIRRFLPIQVGTQCPFSKAAKLWGGKSADGVQNKDALARANAKALAEFVDRIRGSEPDKAERLDGLCIELDDPRAKGPDPVSLGQCVKEVLTGLSDLDPAKEGMMRLNYIGARGWRFRFDRMDFFVTTFAPCYAKTSSRYAFGADRAFVLLQPEVSFARHRLPPDTPHTEWDQPKSIRDKTRVAFRNAGRPYHIPESTNYPPAEHIVKPLIDDGNAVVKWWL